MSIFIILMGLFLPSRSGLTENLPDPEKIVGGYLCSVEEHPYAVSLTIKNEGIRKQFCGGSLIRLNWVLTAAHCSYMGKKLLFPEDITVTAGFSNKNDTIYFQKVKGAYFHRHPKYSWKILFHNDIALLLLKASFDKSPGVNTISLPPKFLSSYNNKELVSYYKTATVMGWGVLEIWRPQIRKQPPNKMSPFLMCVDVRLELIQNCDSYRTKFTQSDDDILCTLNKFDGQDSCKGDSGGAMIINNTVIGIISGGFGCGVAYSPGFYVNLAKHLDFIENKLSNNMSGWRSNEILMFILLFFTL